LADYQVVEMLNHLKENQNLISIFQKQIYKPKKSAFQSSAFVVYDVLKKKETKNIFIFLSNHSYYSDAKSTTRPFIDA
jgi:hypothetical protein